MSDAPDPAALKADPPTDDELAAELPLPPLTERVWRVLTSPGAAFAEHDGRWGWAGPWAVTALIALLLAVGVFARIDLDERVKRRWERMSSSPKAAQLQNLAEDQRDQAARMVAFIEKAKWVVAPLGSLASIVLWGAVAFGACSFLGPRKADLLRCLSVSAYASLAGAVADAAQFVAVVLGRAPVGTGPAALVDDLGNPALSTALTRLDPALLFGYALLAIGLHRSCGLGRRQAWGVCGGAWLLLSLILAGMAGMQGGS